MIDVTVGDQGYLCHYAWDGDRIQPVEVVEVGRSTFKAKGLITGETFTCMRKGGYLYGSGGMSRAPHFCAKTNALDNRYANLCAEDRCRRLVRVLNKVGRVSEQTYNAVRALLAEQSQKEVSE